jgi:pectinesterase
MAKPLKTYRHAPIVFLSTLFAATGGCSSENASPPPSGGGPADGSAHDAAAVGDAGSGNSPSADSSTPDAAASGDAGAGDSTTVADSSTPDAAAIGDAGAGDSTTVADSGTRDAAAIEAATGADNGVIQTAINAAVAAGGTGRVFIRLQPGTYREVVCVPPNAPPITLYSTNPDATQTVVVFNNYNGLAKAATAIANPCTPNNSPTSTSNTTYGTAGSATFSAFAKGFEAKNITFSNDVSDATLALTSGSQAVALMTQADQVVLENVRVLGHQDTLYAESPSSGTIVRGYIKSSFIAGDVDFIFGGATLVVDSSTIEFLSDRKTKGEALSPSTDSLNPYGELVVNGTFTADAAAMAGNFALGRAWDRSCGASSDTYLSTCVAAGHYPNGQAVVRNSTLDAHIAAAPWLPSATTARPFCDEAWACSATGAGTECPANRLFEYQNTGPGASTATPTGGVETPACSNKRPQLTVTEAAADTVLKYLAQAGSVATPTTDNWDPTAGVGDVATFTPTFTVAAP